MVMHFSTVSIMVQLGLNSNVFNGLGVGTYTAVVQYTTGTAVCTTTPQTVTYNRTG